MSISFTSYGAAGTVTGSCHLLEINGRRILIDCGMFQGTPDIEALNREPLDFDPRELDVVCLTHGHLDHCGRLPLLSQKGYRGPIYTTRPSRDVVRLILVDSARVQYEDWSNAQRDGGNPIQDPDRPPPPPPLYSEQDVYETLDLMRPVRCGDEIDLGRGVTAVFREAGHILGSAFIEFEGPSGRFTASGDLGTWGQNVVPDPHLPNQTDAVYIESTYGGQVHEPLPSAVDKLATVIAETVRRGGNVLIPTFALERAQDILFILRDLSQRRRIPEVNAFLDSPLAINFTRLHRRYPEMLGSDVRRVIMSGDDPFSFPGLISTRTQAESRQIEKIHQGAVIMAGSGMATAGRILSHLEKNLHRPESTVIFVGYQGEGTLGRQLIDGAPTVTIRGIEYPVNMRIEYISGFSAHADEPALMRWVAPTKAETVFLVHGETPAPEALQARITSELGINTIIAARGERYPIR